MDYGIIHSILKAYLINLDRSPERLAFMDEQLKRLGVDYERVPAVDGRALTPEERVRGFSRVRSFIASKKRLSDAEVGVAMSHVACCRRVLAEEEPYALVLEDDVVLADGFPAALKRVEAFLSPVLYGYASMHAGANLWFHLLLPLMAIASFCAFEADRPMPLRWTFAAIVPMALYGTGYLANILANGIPGNDWYGFSAWGMERTPIVFAVMVSVVWLIALGLRAANQRIYRSRTR